MSSSQTRRSSSKQRIRLGAGVIGRFTLLAALAALCLSSLAAMPALTASAQDAGSSSLPLRLVQETGDDLDCIDFDFQEEAQEVFDADPSDPNALDPNRDGIACALLPSQDSTREAGIEIAQDADPEADRAARQAEREARRNANAQDGGDETSGDVVSVTCDNFATQEDAQVSFDLDPAAYASLDLDGNGVACDELLVVESVGDTTATGETREERRNRRNQEQGQDRNTDQQANVTIDAPEQTTGPEDLDCIDFQFQEEAQSILDRDLSDPFNLDPNGDGFACSSLPSATPLIVQVPRTGAGYSSAWPMLEYGSLAIFAGMALIAAALLRTTKRSQEYG